MHRTHEKLHVNKKIACLMQALNDSSLIHICTDDSSSVLNAQRTKAEIRTPHHHHCARQQQAGKPVTERIVMNKFKAGILFDLRKYEHFVIYSSCRLVKLVSFDHESLT